jgi:hypothetical protein
MDIEVLQSNLVYIFVLWSVVTAILIILLIYRGQLQNHEEDQIFLDKAGDGMAADQRLLVMRIEKLSRPIVALVVASIVLAVAMGTIWLWHGIHNF